MPKSKELLTGLPDEICQLRARIDTALEHSSELQRQQVGALRALGGLLTEAERAASIALSFGQGGHRFRRGR